MSGITRGDWTKAQELLVKLVQILTPLAESPSTLPPVTIKLFAPKKEEEHPLRHQVRLLPSLQAAQKEVSAWIENYKLSTDPATAFHDPILPRREIPTPFQKIAGEKRVPSSIMQPAQRAIDEVRGAIRVLATSSNLGQPNLQQLQLAMKKIKPVIDQLIDAVETTQDMHSASEQRDKPTFRHPLPANPRATLFRGAVGSILHKLNEEGEKLEEGRVQEKKASFPRSKERTDIQTLLSMRSEEPPQTSPKPQTASERSTLPGAPYTPPPTSSSPRRKEKKKRLFPWEKEDDQDSLERPR